MSNQQLQNALAKMLPEKFIIGEGKLFWKPKADAAPDDEEGGYLLQPVGDTEWLHVCWLVERDLTVKQKENYVSVLFENLTGYQTMTTDYLEMFICVKASWQQRAEALCRVKGIST